MKSFYSRLLLFVAIQLILVVVVALFNRQRGEDYLAATLEKHHRLAATPSPRLILVGGSNLAFGVRSDLLEQSFGVPVVNMGLQAGLGLKFMHNEVKPYLQKGDIVVLSPEFRHYLGDGSASNQKLLRYLLTYRPESSRFLAASDLKSFSDAAHMTVGDMVRNAEDFLFGSFQTPTPPYNRNSFNRYGDVVSHYEMPAPPTDLDDHCKLNDYLSAVRPTQVAIDTLNQFGQLCRSKDVQCFLVHPPYPDTLTEQNLFIDSIIDLAHQSLNLNILNSPASERRPPSEFFDTEYHLTGTGATERTFRMIDLLKNHIEPDSTRYARQGVSHSANTAQSQSNIFQRTSGQ